MEEQIIAQFLQPTRQGSPAALPVRHREASNPTPYNPVTRQK